MAIAKKQLRQTIKENNLQNVDDIYTLFKNSFKEILQEMLEAELSNYLLDIKHKTVSRHLLH